MKKLVIMCLIWLLMGILADVHRHPGCLPPPPPPRWAWAGQWSYLHDGQYVVSTPFTITGKLHQIAMIGGETTGWYIELDRCLCITSTHDPLPTGFGVVGRNSHTVTVDRIEIDYCCPEKLLLLEGKEISVTGFLKWKRGVERGTYWYFLTATVDKK